MNDAHQQLPDIATLLNGFQDPAVVIGADYRILAANQAYRDKHGAIGGPGRRHCYEVSHRFSRPCDEAGETCPLRNSQASGQPQRVLHLHYTARGEEHVDVQTLPLRDESGELRWFLEIMRASEVAGNGRDGAGLVGRSAAFTRMLALVERVASSEAAVLLQGESGSGKELVAKAIHAASAHAAGPFVPVECSGLTESLFESELFGHEKGAFTGAQQRKIGLVEAAAGGTLFLDEVGDIPLPLQVKLLRLLETASYRRVGSVEPRQAQFRLVCATHRDLKRMVAAGAFRQDLYYRINTFPIPLPPLRERGEDVALLADMLLQRSGAQTAKRLHADTLACLRRYDFPGNVRELRNILERATLLADGDMILPEHLPPECVTEPSSVPPGFAGEVQALAEVERRYLQWAVARHRGDKRSLARQLGLSERTFYRKLKQVQNGD
ncbi:Fis family transcriptional regulator [Candidatus Tenderia electrophaga]|jgi:DNA-binding NtrC family response regulator|uniref:Fis family transcriptional regulator n=1 Tax=Candidatus Tenderia electrophaga TaxID=1748243 RepID=A0A0S2T9Y2_9GAMM|nr:Fis family transcriptional regulator [Candidatus Tenderia electrophaga]